MQSIGISAKDEKNALPTVYSKCLFENDYIKILGAKEMSKYNTLWEYIKANGADSIKLTYAEIEKIAGLPLDHSFLTFKKELLEYGFCVKKISMKEKTVLFEKK